MIHPVSGKIREVDRNEFLSLFSPAVTDKINELFEKEGVEAVVCMENLDMTSSLFGDRTALAVGPGRTFQMSTIGDAAFRIGESPSTFQYPTFLCRNVDS